MTKSKRLFFCVFTSEYINIPRPVLRHYICPVALIRALKIGIVREKNTILKNRILIVEDEPILQKNIALSLRREGYEVMEANSGADAWRILDVSSIDFLILDVGLPDYNGLDLLKEIREVHPRLSTIVMTARDAPEVQDRAIEWGAAAFLAKPIALQVLKAEIRSIEEKRGRRQPEGKQ
jgi:DNA-binding response OmpR family regulator